MKPTIDLTTPEGVQRFNREFWGEAREQFMGLLDDKALPEAFRGPIVALKERIDTALNAIKDRPTDQVPAAMQAHYGMESLVRSLTYAQELIQASFEQMNKLIGEFAPKVTQLNELTTKMGSKLILTKDEAEAAAKEFATGEVTKALEGERARRESMQSRRTQLCEAALPAPADEAPLGGDDKTFTAAKAAYVSRMAKLKEAGIAEQLNEAGELASTLYGTEENYGRTVKLMSTRKSTVVADPLIGSPGAATEPAPGAALKKRPLAI